MLNEADQRSRLKLVADAAASEGCLVAPVGSVYFLLQGTGRQYTKDIDAVIHEASLEPAGSGVLRRIAERLGTAEVTVDEAVFNIRTESGLERPDIELIRGRSATKGGFFPRELLVKAARRARREGNVLIYPIEAVLVLKADAAIDREERAERDVARSVRHRERAAVFRADVFQEVNRALLAEGLRAELLLESLRLLKEKRRGRVQGLLAEAGAPLRQGSSE